MSTSIATFWCELSRCRRCGEAGHPVWPPPIFSGPAPARLIVVGQAPGRVEATETRQPFSGSAGRRLFRWLAECGWEGALFRDTSYMTAVTKCYPGPNEGGRGDRVPSRSEQELCRPWLEQELALVQPEIIVPVGGLAVSLFLGTRPLGQAVGRLFHRPHDDSALTEWARRHAPASAQIVPLPHPSGASLWLNRPENRQLVQQALQILARLRRDANG